jgi:TRAP-type transport system small permease protein
MMAHKTNSGELIYIVKKAETNLTNVTRGICFFLLFLIVIAVSLSLVTRYFFFYPLNFSDQLSKYLLIWLSFLGASLGVKYGSHIAIDMFIKNLSKANRKFILIVVDLLISFFLILLIYYGFQFALSAKLFNDPLVFGLNMMYPYLSVPVGSLVLLAEVNLCMILWLCDEIDNYSGDVLEL